MLLLLLGLRFWLDRGHSLHLHRGLRALFLGFHLDLDLRDNLLCAHHRAGELLLLLLLLLFLSLGLLLLALEDLFEVECLVVAVLFGRLGWVRLALGKGLRFGTNHGLGHHLLCGDWCWALLRLLLL